MTSFGYCSNPRYAIKECSFCGTLYTRDCGCSKGNVEDKMLVPKPPKHCARCTRCGYLVDGPNCQGCALLRQELEENLVTHSPDFQNSSEPSNASTNVVNAPREPYVVKGQRDFVDKIIFDLNKAPDSPHLYTISPNQFHCFHCKDVLRDGEAYKRCTCEPSSLFDFEEVMSIPHNNEGPPLAGPPPPNNNGPPPVVRPNGPAPCSMEELGQLSINGRGGPIASISIQATDFGLRHHMIQQVQNTCQFYGLPDDDANRHIDKF
nr:reverse transcriptase domain-containing protein [Tanacetum cinerariifolium]